MAFGTSVRSTVRDQRGSALLASLMVVFGLTIIGLALFDVQNVERRFVVGNQTESAALYAAEAGVKQVRLNWAQGLTPACGSVAAMPTFSGVYNPSPSPPGTSVQLCTNAAFGSVATYSVTGRTSTNPCTAPPGTNATCVTVTSTACPTPATPAAPCVSVQADVVQAVTQTTIPSTTSTTTSTTSTEYVALYPFFAGNTMTLNSSEIVDSFDSAVGPYYDPVTGAACTGNTSCCRAVGCGANLFTNGDAGVVSDNFNKVGGIYGNVQLGQGEIKLGSSGVIYGNVTYDATSASIDCGTNCVPTHVKGTVTATTVTPISLTPVADCTTDPGARSTDTTRNNTSGYTSGTYLANHWHVNSGSITYNDSTGSLSTSSGSSITMDPGTYCFGLVNKIAGSLNIPSGAPAPVVIKANQDAIFGGDLVNSTGNATYMQILSSVNDSTKGVSIGSGTNAYVFVYAPNAQVLVNGHGDILGAVQGSYVSSSGSANLHFDKALGRPCPTGSAVCLGVGQAITKTTYTTTSTTTYTTTTSTNYGQQLWKVCPASGCA